MKGRLRTKRRYVALGIFLLAMLGFFSFNAVINYFNDTTSDQKANIFIDSFQQIENNQLTGAVVGQSGLTTSDAEANSTSCGYINAGLTLTSNVNNRSTCFFINASNLVLDCAGFTITYGESAAGYGVNNSNGYDNITVRNCMIKKAGMNGSNNFGIYMNNGAMNNTILNNTILTDGNDTNYGIYFHTGSNSSRIQNNTVYTNGTGNSNYGISLNDRSSFNNVTGNTIITNGTSDNVGLAFSQSGDPSSGNIVNNNTITTRGGSDNRGIMLSSSDNITITNNLITTIGTSDNYGIYFASENAIGVVENNTVITNGTAGTNYGIYLYHANSTIRNNIINTSGTSDNYGIVFNICSSCFGNIIEGNVINANGSGSGNNGLWLTTGNYNVNGVNLFINNNITSLSKDFPLFYSREETDPSNNFTLIYNNSFGQINWTLTNLTTNITLQLGSTIFIQNNLVGLTDNAQALNLNGSAVIAFYGLNATNHTLLRNGVRCDNNASLCNITSARNAATLVAQVARFSNYTTQEACGDGTCNLGENCTSCSSDCGSYNCSSPIDCTRVQLANGTYTEFNIWLSGGDAILVLDRNGDGTIAAEDLFGSRNLTARDVDNGFEDLALLDTNGDGVITNDSNATQLQLWRRNSSSLELVPINQTTIVSINLAYVDNGGPFASQNGTFTNSIELRSAQVVNGNFTSTTYGGIFGGMLVLDMDGDGQFRTTSCTQCSSQIAINLESPGNNADNTTDSTPSFAFNATDNNATYECTLFINSSGTITPYDSNLSVVNATSTIVTANATLSNGDYYWFINCTDERNSYVNLYSSTSRNISINVASSSSSTTTSSSSSSGGGGGTMAAATHVITTGELTEGYSRTLKIGEKIKFPVSEEDHKATLEKIFGSAVSITIESDVQNITLSEGSSQKLELNGDNNYDVLISVKNITIRSAVMTIQETSGDIVEIVQPEEEILPPPSFEDLPAADTFLEPLPEEEASSTSYYLGFMAIALFITLAIVFWIRKQQW